jgi:initiation factor 1A
MHNTSEQENIRVPLPEKRKNEMFAVVECQVYGGLRMNVLCQDGKPRLARIPGGKKRKLRKIRMRGLLIISP